METQETSVVRGKSLQAWKLGWEPSAAHSIFLRVAWVVVEGIC